MEADLVGDRAVCRETGVAVAADLGHLVVAREGEVRAVRCVAAVQPDFDRTERHSAGAIDQDVAAAEHVYGLGVREVHLGDPTFADQRMRSAPLTR